MKKIYAFIVASLLSANALTQAPQMMSYQAVVRDASNNLVASSTIGMQVSILQGSPSGTAVYVETQTPTSNQNGLVSIEIGNGTVVSGGFSTIDWENGPFFIKTETDPTGGTSYTITGVSQFLSVPYALYAKVAGSVAINRSYIYLRKKATPQNIANNTNTQITNYDVINTSDFLLNNSTGTITFNRSGVYTITGHITFAALNPGRKLIWFNCTSANHPGRIASTEVSNDANRVSTSIVGEFNAGDQITLSTFQNTGVTVAVPNNTQTFDEVSVNIERIH